MLHGEYGINDICLSIPTLIGPNGVRGKVPIQLTGEEIHQLHVSADALQAVIDKIRL